MMGDHTVRNEGGWQTVFWLGNAAADEATADRAVLQQFFPGCGYSAVEEFQLPKDRHRLENWRRTLGRAFAEGKRARSREVLELLGGIAK